jgi:hypothetical protein
MEKEELLIKVNKLEEESKDFSTIKKLKTYKNIFNLSNAFNFVFISRKIPFSRTSQNLLSIGSSEKDGNKKL